MDYTFKHDTVSRHVQREEVEKNGGVWSKGVEFGEMQVRGGERGVGWEGERREIKNEWALQLSCSVIA